jgi:glycosyltransferase involved in cell wall biosynthesis
MPVISVIVPNFNHAPYLEQRIESILNQTFQDFELILLDDCSTDSSVEVLKRYAEHPKLSHLVINEQNSGSTFRQWDKGIALAKGEYVWIAESDDVADPFFLETISKFINNQTDIGLAYTQSRLIDSKGNVTYEPALEKVDPVKKYSGTEFIRKKLLFSNVIWNASMMIFRKSLYENIDKSQFVNMKYCGDWFFYTLISEHSNVLEISQVLNNFRVHSQNVSTKAESYGKTFFEGLDIYNYGRKYLSFPERFNADYQWAKQLYKSKQKYHFSTALSKDISKKLLKKNLSILVLNKLYVFFKNKS